MKFLKTLPTLCWWLSPSIFTSILNFIFLNLIAYSTAIPECYDRHLKLDMSKTKFLICPPCSSPNLSTTVNENSILSVAQIWASLKLSWAFTWAFTELYNYNTNKKISAWFEAMFTTCSSYISAEGGTMALFHVLCSRVQVKRAAPSRTADSLLVKTRIGPAQGHSKILPRKAHYFPYLIHWPEKVPRPSLWGARIILPEGQTS